MYGKIKINEGDLEMAVDTSDYESEAYLDTETGDVITKAPYTMEMVEDVLEAGSLDEALKHIDESDEIPDFSREFAKQVLRIEWDVVETHQHMLRSIIGGIR